METRLKTANHAAHSLHYHVILTIKYRNKCLTGEMLDRLRELFAKGCAQWRCRLVEFGGEADHVHLLIEGHPAMNLARMIGNLKTVSARRMRQEYAAHLRGFFWKARFWNNAYAVVSVGGHANLAQLLDYIQDQERPPG